MQAFGRDPLPDSECLARLLKPHDGLGHVVGLRRKSEPPFRPEDTHATPRERVQTPRADDAEAVEREDNKTGPIDAAIPQELERGYQWIFVRAVACGEEQQVV